MMPGFQEVPKIKRASSNSRILIAQATYGHAHWRVLEHEAKLGQRVFLSGDNAGEPNYVHCGNCDLVTRHDSRDCCFQFMVNPADLVCRRPFPTTTTKSVTHSAELILLTS
jgi:hypothetical protein